MKQNSLSDKLLTEKKLKEILEAYPTREDLSQSLDVFRKEQDFHDSQMEERLRGYISEFSNRIVTAIDPLLRELETRQQDREN